MGTINNIDIKGVILLSNNLKRIKMINTIAVIEVNIVMCNLFGCSFVFMCALEMYRVTSRITEIFFKSCILLLDSHGIVMKPSFVHYTCFIYRFK